MSNRNESLVGQPIPDVELGECMGGEILTRRAPAIFGEGRSIIAGVPGAFTPICTQKHIPELIRRSPELRMKGFAPICIATSDPFSLDAWARIVDPDRKVRFLSDGNLAFARALNFLSNETKLFLGERSARYSLKVVDGIIRDARVETSILNFECTWANAELQYV